MRFSDSIESSSFLYQVPGSNLNIHLGFLNGHVFVPGNSFIFRATNPLNPTEVISYNFDYLEKGNTLVLSKLKKNS